MKRNILFISLCGFISLLVFLQFNCSSQNQMSDQQLVERGKYLVNLGGCNDCHSPKVMTQMGPMPDSTKLLSGYSEQKPVPSFDPSLTAPGKWVLTDGESTIWAGPWGVSFSANITSDSTTGIGAWTLENFVITMRSGKHLGTGRMVLPPMPWHSVGQLPDEDLKALFMYLKTVPAVKNRVPNPMPPAMAANMPSK